MTPTRLRGWMKKYGDWGGMMVAAYFAGCWLWRKRFVAVPAVLLFVWFGVVMLHLRHKPHVSPKPASASAVAPVPVPRTSQPEEKPKVAKDVLEDTRTVREGQDVWRMEIWGPQEENASDYYLKFYRNSQLVKTIGAADMGGHTLEFGKIRFVTDFPVIVVAAGGLCSPNVTARLYELRQERLVQMVELGADSDGPILHDYDGDGKPEWVFDDYRWGREQDESPKHYLIYKEQTDGTLKLWKRLPNPQHRRLPPNHE